MVHDLTLIGCTLGGVAGAVFSCWPLFGLQYVGRRRLAARDLAVDDPIPYQLAEVDYRLRAVPAQRRSS